MGKKVDGGGWVDQGMSRLIIIGTASTPGPYHDCGNGKELVIK